MKSKSLQATLLLSIVMCTSAHAKDIIFKCVDDSGNIAYLNVNTAKKGTCNTTQLADIDKLSTAASANARKNQQNSNRTISSNSTSSSFIKDDGQEIRDTKRKLILTKELNEETEQLETINAMLKNSDTKDTQQLSQLQQMQSIHNRNITTLQKELGIAKLPVEAKVSVKDKVTIATN